MIAAAQQEEVMAQAPVDLADLPVIATPGHIAILQRKWYPEILTSMSSICERVPCDRGHERVETRAVPGCLELPLAAADLLATSRIGDLVASVCFGMIVRG